MTSKYEKPVLDNGFIVVDCNWEVIIEMINNKTIFLQDIELPDQYYLFALDEQIKYKCIIYKETVPDNSIMSQEDNDTAKTIFENNYKNTLTNKPLKKRQKDGAQWVSNIDLQAHELIETTVNYADKTTWFTSATRITNQELTGDVENLIFSCPEDTVILDMYHGKIFDENQIAKDLDPTNLMDVKVYVDGNLKTMREPFKNSGGDYEVNYLNGQIIFFSAQANVTVTASYHKVVNSSWKLVPIEGKVLEINYAEIDVSDDIIMNDTIVFTAYGLVDAFAPQLVENNIVPSGTIIPIDETKYKTLKQMRQEAVGTTPPEPAMGGSVRGVTRDWRTMPFRYRATRQLWASLGMYLEIKLENDLAFEGENATATFHCLSRDEKELK